MSDAIPLTPFVSPFDTYQSVDALVADAQKVHLPGYQTRVTIPTMYGDWYQGSPGINRSLGDELCPDSVDGYRALRERIEAAGVPCDGWCVPVAPDDDYTAQGQRHGLIASVFDTFVINLEHGWSNFWSEDGAPIVRDYLTGFWQGVDEGGATDRLNGRIGLTIVTNTAMMNALDDSELVEWIGGTNYDTLEAYIPGDPGLDPDNALNIWHARLAAVGADPDRQVVLILEQGDLPSLATYYANPTYGTMLWTLQSAAQQTWPDVGEDPCAEQNARIDTLTQTLGYIGGDLLAPVAKLKFSAQPKAVQRLITGIRAECDKLGIVHA